MTIVIDQKPSSTKMSYGGTIRDGKKDVHFTLIQSDYGVMMGKNTTIEFLNEQDEKNGEYEKLIFDYITSFDLW